MSLRRHCGLPRVLNSPVFQLALRAGRYFEVEAVGFEPTGVGFVDPASEPAAPKGASIG